MGCVFGRELSARAVPGSKEVKSSSIEAIAKNDDNASATKVDRQVSKFEVQNGGRKLEAGEENKAEDDQQSRELRRQSRTNARPVNFSKQVQGEHVAAGWPSWLSEACGEALSGWIPRRANTFEKIDKIGQGTYSNVYKAKDMLTGKVVALKKVRFDNLEPESVKFMAREILILRRLDHPNVVKLEGLVTSRMSCSLYLVFQYMEHDLAGLAASPDIKFTESQVKCYMNQLLSGLEHCHTRNVLHRDIKGSNLLIDNDGVLKIADFGLASIFDPNSKHPMTSRVVTLWYRPPELLLGSTDYGVGVDLWSAGCILAELLAGKPVMPGRTEVEQLHKIYKLCGSPPDAYWRKYKLPNATLFKPREPYRRSIKETFNSFPPSSLPLIETLLAIDPEERLTATAALQSEFFSTEPYACDPSSLPKYPPTKEIDAKRRDDELRRLKTANKAQGDDAKKTRARNRAARAYPAPDANAELQTNIDRRRMISHTNGKSKSEKFPPPHQDGATAFPFGASQYFDPALPPDIPFSTSSFTYSKDLSQMFSGPVADPAHTDAHGKRKKHSSGGARRDKGTNFLGGLNKSFA